MKVELETLHLQTKNNLLKLIFNHVLRQIQGTQSLLRELIALVISLLNLSFQISKKWKNSLQH